jgi:hypothetical protein
MDFMTVSCICLPMVRAFSCRESAERHRRPPLDLRIGPLAPELGDGFQDPPAGTLGTPLPLAGEFGTHVLVEGLPSTPFFGEFGTHVPEDVPSMPFFGEFGTHVPEDVPSMPFFGVFGLHVPFPGPVPMQFITLPSQPLRQPLGSTTL